MQNISPAHTITSPNISIKPAPPITTAVTTTNKSTININANTINNNIINSSFKFSHNMVCLFCVKSKREKPKLSLVYFYYHGCNSEVTSNFVVTDFSVVPFTNTNITTNNTTTPIIFTFFILIPP